jgi:hypothetical protein
MLFKRFGLIVAAGFLCLGLGAMDNTIKTKPKKRSCYRPELSHSDSEESLMSFIPLCDKEELSIAEQFNDSAQIINLFDLSEDNKKI